MSETIGVYEIKSKGIKSASKDTQKLKKDVQDVNKEAKESLGNFRLFGVSLNSIGAGFTKIKGLARASFATIKAGLISTGIGAFVIAIGSLIGYFTNTKRGADQLKVALTGISATFDVLKDRISTFGEGLTFIFSGEFQKGAEMLKNSFRGIADEIANESKAMMDLKRRTNELRDAENDFMIQKAETRQEIEKARLIAEDETKSAQERLENLKKALDLEAQTTKRELELAEERMRIQEEEMALSENSAEDEARLAQLKVELIEKETASVKMRRRVVTEVNSLEREIRAEEKARFEERQKEMMTEMESIKTRVELKEKEIKQVDIPSFEKQKEIHYTLEELNNQRIEWEAMSGQERLSIANNVLGNLGRIAGEESKASKALAITSATINTYDSAVKSYNSLAGIPVVGPVLGGIASAAAVASGLANVRAIASAGKGGGGGGGARISTPRVPSASSQIPSPQMTSGAFTLQGAVPEIEPARAFVVSDDITNNQNKLENIRRRATI
jgi:hypothetical protein